VVFNDIVFTRIRPNTPQETEMKEHMTFSVIPLDDFQNDAFYIEKGKRGFNCYQMFQSK